jgi:SAM-dependent methyltransferase
MLNLNNIMGNRWSKKQAVLKEWRDQIWECNNEAAIKTYIDWHLDFFTRFYQPPLTSSHVLDIGCGYMIRNFYQAQKLDYLMTLINCQYIGIDPIDDWFVHRQSQDIEFYMGHGEDLPFSNGSFDAALLLGTLDHVLNPHKVLSETHRILKKGGKLWFANSYVEGGAWKILKAKLYHGLGFDKHHRFIWTPRGLKSILSQANFYIERTAKCLCDTSFYIEGRK